jgi:hypothetical protein
MYKYSGNALMIFRIKKVFFIGVEKSSYTVNEYIKNIGKEREESNPILLLSRLVSYSF